MRMRIICWKNTMKFYWWNDVIPTKDDDDYEESFPHGDRCKREEWWEINYEWCYRNDVVEKYLADTESKLKIAETNTVNFGNKYLALLEEKNKLSKILSMKEENKSSTNEAYYDKIKIMEKNYKGLLKKVSIN